MFNLKVAASATLLLLAHVNLCFGRPAILQEQTIGYYTNFFKGCWVGVETVLSLLGYYEDGVVKANLASKTLDVNAADEEDQTSIQIAGLGLGRTGSTSLSMALEILGFTVCTEEDLMRWEGRSANGAAYAHILFRIFCFTHAPDNSIFSILSPPFLGYS